MKKKFFAIAALLLTASSTFAEPNVVKVNTSCGKVAYIDTNRTSMENTVLQIMDIDAVLCSD